MKNNKLTKISGLFKVALITIIATPVISTTVLAQVNNTTNITPPVITVAPTVSVNTNPTNPNNTNNPNVPNINGNNVVITPTTEIKVEEETKELEKPQELFEKYKNENRIETLSKIGFETELLKKLNEYKKSLEELNKEDKNKEKDSKEGEGANNTKNANGQIVAPAFNPVIRGGTQRTGLNNATNLMGLDPNQALPEITPLPAKATVYSIMGFENDYNAKLSLDGKSTYIVKKGDILPDGQKVTEITRYYVVLKEQKAKGRELQEPQKYYVTGRQSGNGANTGNTGAIPTSLPGVASSGNMGSIVAPGNSNINVLPRPQNVGVTPSGNSIVKRATR